MAEERREERPEVAYPLSADGYDLVAEIGTGAFATVYKATVDGTKEEVAIKVLELEKFNTQWEEIRKEIQIMSSLHHANIVKILVSFVVDADLWIVMPLLSGGSCASIMKKISSTGFKDEALIATILRETLKGLEYLHKGSQLHRDVKAGNILVSAQGEIQLGDLGVAGNLVENGDRKQKRSTFTGTPCWMAPEVMEQSSGYDEKADIWSFGITAMELAFGHAPYAKYPPMKVLLMTLQEDPPTFDVYNDEAAASKFSKEFQKMIAKCLQKEPAKRPSASKLLKNAFFKKARDAAYIVEKLVKPLPTEEHKAVDPTKLRRSKKDGGNKAEKEKPLSVGPWSFGQEEMKKQREQASLAQIPEGSLSSKQLGTAGSPSSTAGAGGASAVAGGAGSLNNRTAATATAAASMSTPAPSGGAGSIKGSTTTTTTTTSTPTVVVTGNGAGSMPIPYPTVSTPGGGVSATAGASSTRIIGSVAPVSAAAAASASLSNPSASLRSVASGGGAGVAVASAAGASSIVAAAGAPAPAGGGASLSQRTMLQPPNDGVIPPHRSESGADINV